MERNCLPSETASDVTQSKSSLLVLNYVMDLNHPSLSHQVEVVRELGKYFKAVHVLTGKKSWDSDSKNIRVDSTNWRPGHNLRNIARLYFRTYIKLRRFPVSIVFSHMTLVQSALLAPVFKALGIKHFVWYAHAQNSVFLKWVHLWVDGIFTSTIGSCPIKSKKIIYLGQGIDASLFIGGVLKNAPIRNLVHFGRVDPSKDISTIISAVQKLRRESEKFHLDIVGSPSNESSDRYLASLKQKWVGEIESGWLQFKPSVPRNEIPELLKSYDCFIHAFKGSLDKTLIEATLSLLPVITLNQEYLREFTKFDVNENVSLETQLRDLVATPKELVNEMLESRKAYAVQNHSLSRWTRDLATILIAADSKAH